jgi:RNA polymerase sigma-70 factor (ECF subfamily)
MSSNLLDERLQDVGTTILMERLSRRYRIPLLRFFEKRIGRHAEAEDLVQDVFLRLTNSANLCAVEQLEGYLFQTAANLLRDRRRRLIARASAAHEPYQEALHGAAQLSSDPEVNASGAQAIEQLVAALAELPERTRAVFVLYHFEHHSHAEIGRRLGIAVSTIEKHMSRAGSHLLKRMNFPI